MCRLLPLFLFACLLLAMITGILFSQSGVDGSGDFSRQYFLSLADSLAPTATPAAGTRASLLRPGVLLATSQLVATSLPESGGVRLLSKKGDRPSLLFRIDYNPPTNTIPVLGIRTGTLRGLPRNQVLTLHLYWSADTNFSDSRSITFQLMAHSYTAVFLGRKQPDLRGPFLLRLDLPVTAAGQTAHEFLTMEIYPVGKRYLTTFYPPNLNYDGIVPATAGKMLAPTDR